MPFKRLHMLFSTKQKAILAAICDAIIPSIERTNDIDAYWKRKASDIDVAGQFLNTVQKLPEEQQKEIAQLLSLLDSRLVGLTYWGPFKGVQKLSVPEREVLLQKWARSPIPMIRAGFISLKKLATFIYYSHTPKGKHNPNWKVLGYDGPIGQPHNVQDVPRLPIIKVATKTVLHCDVVVVGSGAGGGVIAGELSAAGQEVIVIEKGEYIHDSGLNQLENDMVSRLYERRGALSSADGAVSIFAGTGVGGGTMVNWAGAFRTPDYILQEWATEHGNPQFLDPEYVKGFEAVEARTGVNTNLKRHNPQNQALWEGCERLGYHMKQIPRNELITGYENGEDNLLWKKCGFGILGDAFGQKQGTHKTYLQDACANGAKILANTLVNKVIIQAGKAKGVYATYTNSNGQAIEVEVRAKRVVVCAGAIHTPALLLRSGLRHQHIGKHLYLHPTVAVPGVYKHSIRSWYGPMMSAVSDEFARLEGNYGFKLETAPVHAGFMAMALPWTNGQQFKQDMLDAANTAVFIVLTRDKFGGKVSINKQGQPVIDYTLHAFDRKHMIRGMQEATKIHAAAGAQKIRLVHNEPETWETGVHNLQDFTKCIAQKKWSTNRYTLYSAHQMGTCRMGGNKGKYPLTPTGETREVRNLYVADASAMPKCSGANPMLSIQALAHYIAQGLK